MLIRTWLFIFAFLPFLSTVEAGFFSNVKNLFTKTQRPVPAIDVLVLNDETSALVEVKGKYHLYNPFNKKLISKRYISKKKAMQPVSSGLKWGEEFPGIFQLTIIPEDASTVISVNDIEYKGSITIYDIGGTISIVNRVPIEDYLRSVLPGKYVESMPEEVMASIAIVARTDAYYLAKKPKNKYWSVDGNRVGYHGNNSMNPRTPMDLAILSTRHMVLSQTGAYEGKVTPFAAHWRENMDSSQLVNDSRITLYEAEEIARTGGHAAQILSKAFPGSHIELIY